MKQFIEQTKNDLIQKVKNMEHIPMTVFNLVFDEKENSYNVFVHNFSLNEDVKVDQKLEVVKNCILGAEWESDQLGLKNICTLYGESFEKDGNPCLYIQIKNGDEQRGEFHFFEQKGMTVNEYGVLTSEDNDICYVCDLNK
jgi:hypothetical protein